MLECRKLRRSCLFPALAVGALLAAALPMVNLSFRAESYVRLSQPALEILVQAHWDIIAMLNSCLIIVAACIIYHVEFANNAIQRMDALLVMPGQLFLCKLILLAALLLPVVLIETAGLAFCAWRWFSPGQEIFIQLLQLAASTYLTLLPLLALMLAAASVCPNLWTALGFGITGIFAAQLLISMPWMRYLPFLAPYAAVWHGAAAADAPLCAASVGEVILFAALGPILSRIRRNAI